MLGVFVILFLATQHLNALLKFEESTGPRVRAENAKSSLSQPPFQQGVGTPLRLNKSDAQAPDSELAQGSRVHSGPASVAAGSLPNHMTSGIFPGCSP